MDTEHPFKSTAFRYGFYLAISLIAVFMSMKALDLIASLAFRIVDIVLIYFIVGRSLHYFQRHAPFGHSYLRNLGLSTVTAFFGMFIFAIFIFLYLSIMDQGYMRFLQEVLPMGPHLNPYIIAAFLIIEGVAVGALSGFIQSFLIKKPEL
jgi:hypothetical protein